MFVNSNNKIFVSIASYRDSGVCWQYDMKDNEDADCFKEDLSQYESNISSIRMDYRDAKGPCLARYLCQTLYRGERYYLQIDSHMRFIKEWDEILINQLKQCPSSKPVLTAYPMGYTLPNNLPNYTYPTLLVARSFGSQDKMLRLGSRLAAIPKLKSPVESLFWIAGFSFSYGSMITEVHYDPHLCHLFFGEEMLMSARLWTSGYDFYSPTHAILFHLWKRSHRPTFTELSFEEDRQKSHHRLREIMGIPSDSNDIGRPDIEKYSLGTQRSIDQYQEYCGVNFSSQSISEKALKGGHNDSFFLNEIIEMAIKSQQDMTDIDNNSNTFESNDQHENQDQIAQLHDETAIEMNDDPSAEHDAQQQSENDGDDENRDDNEDVGNGEEDEDDDDDDDDDEEDEDDDDVNLVLDTDIVESGRTARSAIKPGYIKGVTSITPGSGAKYDVTKQTNTNFQTNRPQKSIYDVSLDSFDDKPWNKPGADITDYFNYNFTEDTWKAYCERQNQIRAEQNNLGKIKSYESKNQDNKNDILPPEFLMMTDNNNGGTNSNNNNNNNNIASNSNRDMMAKRAPLKRENAPWQHDNMNHVPPHIMRQQGGYIPPYAGGVPPDYSRGPGGFRGAAYNDNPNQPDDRRRDRDRERDRDQRDTGTVGRDRGDRERDRGDRETRDRDRDPRDRDRDRDRDRETRDRERDRETRDRDQIRERDRDDYNRSDDRKKDDRRRGSTERRSSRDTYQSRDTDYKRKLEDQEDERSKRRR
ncbi:cleavage and polyadenylation specificity factor FIP1 [Heterostelium album PN500]|uniref:Cleavage and polyadenylation specificity factor FIP1 n=1 Tax=Heterostelium pallidum (strain ATCC 26659 / Pp 5 / PN500) TaxID=670386 RepID=D3BEA6_HETP5|nr:cleavage and polyadenylation specificity factor FIP1 [Heterostelium album PN500]EFA80237.1 cleavage and polyadenylation specificity factor FIP1 [Heterostelium album PN500]|eukprot:XP_020432357.1 cleavage and polyadenylation specificity factor FIP1 [Heterostelium album PN500]